MCILEIRNHELISAIGRFSRLIIWLDESCISNARISNRYNSRDWSRENHHILKNNKVGLVLCATLRDIKDIKYHFFKKIWLEKDTIYLIQYVILELQYSKWWINIDKLR